MIAIAFALMLQTAAPTGWELSSREDPMTDVTTHTATLTSGRKGINVSCTPEGFTASYVDLDGIGAVPHWRLVEYRFDDQPMIQGDWKYGDQAVFAYGSNARQFLMGLGQASRVRIRASTVVGAPSVGDFDVSGIGEAIASLNERCGLLG